MRSAAQAPWFTSIVPASLIAANNEVSCKGFDRKAMAPVDLQRSRTAGSSCAVMMMAGDATTAGHQV
jgi:hypothetical protein